MFMRKLLAIVLAVAVAAVLLSGCTGGKTEDNGKLNIVVTIFPEYDFVRAIAGDRVNLHMLTPPGASTHSFEPAPGDIVKIQNADIFIYLGGESDRWVKNILDSLDTSGITVLRLMEHVDAYEEEIKKGMKADGEDDRDEDSHDGAYVHGSLEDPEYDEHIWTSPKNAILLIDVIRDAMCARDSENAAVYTENAKAYQDSLKELDARFIEVVETAARKKIVVADKFPFLYFVRAYGLDYAAAFPGCSDQADAGAATMIHLVKTVTEENIPYVYYVELSNKNVASAISEQTGAGMLLLNSCHNVARDDFESGVTYLSLMEQNVENLRKGLN